MPRRQSLRVQRLGRVARLHAGRGAGARVRRRAENTVQSCGRRRPGRRRDARQEGVRVAACQGRGCQEGPQGEAISCRKEGQEKGQEDQESQEGNEDQQQNEQQNEAPEEQESSESNSEQNTPSQSSNEEFEEQQALEQWLRRIEDDPGELLRRKFRYQYRQRQLNGTANSIQNGGQIW